MTTRRLGIVLFPLTLRTPLGVLEQLVVERGHDLDECPPKLKVVHLMKIKPSVALLNCDALGPGHRLLPALAHVLPHIPGEIEVFLDDRTIVPLWRTDAALRTPARDALQFFDLVAPV
jgi:hypothetical protein